MKHLFVVLWLSVCTWAAGPVCSANQYDMLDWMTQDGSSGHSMSGTANPIYTYQDWNTRSFYWTKSSIGYPWDVNYFDTTSTGYIYQWVTENGWNDPSAYKAFATKTTMPWSHRCVTKGATGAKLDSITVPAPSYSFYSSGCTLQSTYNLGNTVNEIWDNGSVTIAGGNLPANAHELALSYRYSCDSNYDKCKYKEVFEFQQKYGLVRWTYYVLTDGVYVQNNQTVLDTMNTLPNGPLMPQHPCWQ